MVSAVHLWRCGAIRVLPASQQSQTIDDVVGGDGFDRRGWIRLLKFSRHEGSEFAERKNKLRDTCFMQAPLESIAK